MLYTRGLEDVIGLLIETDTPPLLSYLCQLGRQNCVSRRRRFQLDGIDDGNELGDFKGMLLVKPEGESTTYRMPNDVVWRLSSEQDNMKT